MEKSNLTTCKKCGKEIAKIAVICPGCGAKIKKPAYKKWWFWLIIIVFFAAVSSPSDTTVTTNESSNSNSNIQTDVKTPVQKKEKFTLESHAGAYDEAGFAFYIEGIIKNNTNREYSYVQVTFNTYDKDGAQLGTAVANINNLEPNGIWKYKAIALTTSGEIASYKLDEITGW